VNTVDERDLSILYELSLDSRQPFGRIAKKVDMSRQAVSDRVKRLLQNGVIRGFITEVDAKPLGLTKNVVYLELMGATKEKEEEIQKVLLSNPYVCWIDLATGRWNFIFDLYSRDSDHLAVLIDRLKENVGECLEDLALVSLRNHEHFIYKYFSTERPSERSQLSEKIALDGRDLVILRHLSENSRCSLSPIARETGLTPEAVSRRINVLVEAGVIRRFTLFVDISKLGYELYNVQISLTAPNKSDEKGIIEYLTKHPKVSYCEMLITHWNIEFGVFIRHPDELRDVIRELRGAFPRKIRVTDTHLFYDELSSIALPEGCFRPPLEPIIDNSLIASKVQAATFE